MSLTGAMNAAVSAMQAQSTALSIISNNLANVSTTGYKASSASFASLLTSGSTTSSSGGVTASKSQNILASGTLVSSSVSTNIAVDGDGFFAVTSGDGSEVYYTRNGAFTVDDDTGYLTNNGYSLLGWPTDADGNVVGGTTETNLEIIDTDKLAGYAAATTSISLDGTLPANAAVGDEYTSELELYDSLGTAYTMNVTWTKTDVNTWTMSFGDLTTGDGTVDSSASVTTTPSTVTITFNSDGTLASPEAATLSISGMSDGASTMSVSLDFGTANASDGLSQYTPDDSSSSTTVDIACTGNGCAYGTLSGVTIDEDGTVYANYSNGKAISIYKIPLATFSNANGLTEMSNSVYSASSNSSGASYHFANSDGVGSIQSSELEESTTDTNTEFSSMIAAQQAYSAASQVISTAKDMFDSLLSAVR
ncbi:FlgE protein [uncultured Pleomorphomonas sp.]|uniref:Flagellar hook protein FlgE n=2 Tax=Pleomorphomonas TaxID=261933 RepID=A0A2G9WTY0_9HYPH|nr:flagellar hook protein FlgE [Pleomorphomonas carboxyditropha]PIO98153.1 flagellar hook protein FlgE [Pleomorphomonas carboxyditropha]SCM74333.1 FlgE protein [uncultured Pleomorphomonas sp.]